MVPYNLTEEQKHLLEMIVSNLREGKILEPILSICTHGKCNILGLTENFGPNLEGDLSALCDLDLMGYRYNSKGDRVYAVKQAGYDAVENDFILPETPANAQVNIGAIVYGMNGGNLQAIGFADHTEVQQIANDPRLLKEQVDILTNQLLDAVKTDLSADSLINYTKIIEDFKEQITSNSPSPSIMQRLFGAIAFLGDIEGTISLTARVWPFIYPLLMIAVERLGVG